MKLDSELIRPHPRHRDAVFACSAGLVYIHSQSRRIPHGHRCIPPASRWFSSVSRGLPAAVHANLSSWHRGRIQLIPKFIQFYSRCHLRVDVSTVRPRVAFGNRNDQTEGARRRRPVLRVLPPCVILVADVDCRRHEDALRS